MTSKFIRSLVRPYSFRQFASASHKGAGINVFDRSAKMNQRAWAVHQPDFDDAQFLHKELAYRVADRVYDCTTYFPVALDLGAQLGYIAPHIFKENVGTLIQMEMCGDMLHKAQISQEVHTHRVQVDEELVPFADESLDLIVSSMSMHWINDLPGMLKRCFTCLRPDGAIIFCMLGGDTLFQLRCSLQLAEQERKGGMASHISPFAQPQDVSSLLTRAGFRMQTIDMDELTVGYDNIYKLMHDLQLMAEGAAAYRRSTHIDKHVLHAASAIYHEMYGIEDGSLPATFQCMFAIGWKPGPNLSQPAMRGSATASLKDLDKLSPEL